MSSTKDEKDSNGRREFFQGITSGMGGLAMIAALSQMGVPILNAAQGGEPDAVGAASEMSQSAKPAQGSQAKQAQGGQAKPKSAESAMFSKSPPWPTGTNGHIYDHLFGTKLRENSMIPDIVPGPQAYFRGDSDLPGAKVNMGWQIFAKPYRLELMSHHHDVDEYLFFLGSTFPDLCGAFDAEVELFLGTEYERHIITKACVLYIPAGFEHNPCDIRRVGKPIFFSALQLAPYFNGVYQGMGYSAMRGSNKIDLAGNPIK